MRRSGRKVDYECVDHFEVLDIGIRGATVKNVLRCPKTHRKYIAKLGSPNSSDREVMTEYAIYLVGRTLGVPIARARIARFNGQLRFLSEYFLDDEKAEELVHGMQLFTALYDDPTVNKVIGNLALEQEMFNVQAVNAAFGAHYYQHGELLRHRLFAGFVAMLTHDAVIGVQDRHHENWGLIVQRDTEGAPPRFAPLYDSARGLFCNMPDEHLPRLFVTHPGQGEQQLDRYIARSRPLVGYRGLQPSGRSFITHEQLITAIFKDFPEHRNLISGILDRYDWQAVRASLTADLSGLCSPQRMTVLLVCLRRRVRSIRRALTALFEDRSLRIY